MKYAIIAAGDGSRLASEGLSMPKPMAPINGEPMIKRLIDILVGNGASAINVIVNPAMPAVRQYLDELSLPVPLSVISKTTPSSMHSFYEVTKSFSSGKFIVTTVDTLFDPAAFADYVHDFDSDDSCDGYMGVTDYIDDEKPLYIETDPDMMVTDFRDQPWPGAKFISAGVYGLKANALGILAKCLDSGMERMRNFQRALAMSGLRLKAYPLGTVIDVDHAADIAAANQLFNCQDNLIP